MSSCLLLYYVYSVVLFTWVIVIADRSLLVSTLRQPHPEQYSIVVIIISSTNVIDVVVCHIIL